MSSHLENQFADLWLYHYPDIDLVSEHRFASPRRYRWDFAHLETKIGIDIQGGTWMRRSGHSGGTGVRKDCEKMCVAAANGWRVFLLTGDMITCENIELISRTIASSLSVL